MAIAASAPTIRLARPRGTTARRGGRRLLIPEWATQWQFWLVVVLGAILRLLPLRYSPFGIDAALLMLEATRAAHEHVLPGTGIYNSILALNPPLYTYLLLPFADHPMGMVVLTALANIAAVAGLYVFADRFFGRRVALLAGLFYATSCYDTYLSTFIWQQTILAPFVIAALATLYMAVVRGRSRAFTVHVALVALLTLLYPPMLSLAALSLVGLVLARRSFAWRALVPGATASFLLALPMLTFELMSHGIDLPVYAAYLAAPKHIDGAIFHALAQALGPRPWDYLGAQTLYGTLGWWLGWLKPVLFALAMVSLLWVIAMVTAPMAIRLLGRDLSGARALAGHPSWRAWLLIVIWPLALVALTLSHSSPIYVHYAFIVTPTLYVAIGLFLTHLPAQLDGLLGWYRGDIVATIQRLAGRGVAFLLALQTLATTLFVLSFAFGQAAAASRGELSLAGYQQALDVADATATRLGAHQAYFVGEAENPYTGLYWTARANDLHASTGPAGPAGAQAPTWVSYVASDCIVTPPAADGPGVLLLADNRGLAARHAIAQPSVVQLGRTEVAPGTFFPLYMMPPAPPGPARPLAIVNGELRLESASVAPADGDLPTRLVTQWTLLSTLPPSSGVARYHFHFTLAASGAATRDTWADCAPSAWIAGEGITLVTPLPESLEPQRWHARVVVSRDMHTWYQPRLGPLTLATAKELTLDPVTLPLGTKRTGGLSESAAASLDIATIALPALRLPAGG